MRNYSRFLLLLIILTAIVAYNCQGAEAKERILERAISEQEVWERVSEPIIEEPAPEEEVAAEPGEEVAPPPKEPKKGWVRTINESISPFVISGEYRVNFGWERDDPIITESNFIPSICL